MMKLIIVLIFISANCMKINCDEEVSVVDDASEVSENAELRSADPESLQSKAENNEAENKANEDSEEVRMSRSPSDSTKDESQFEDSIIVHSTEATLAEKSASDEVIDDTDRKAVEEIPEPKSGTDTAQVLEDDVKSAENVEKQLEDLPVTPGSASEAEDRKPEDLLEASAESKLSDKEKASSILDESDRNSETDEIKEQSNNSGVTEILGTRRMLSAPDNVVVDTKMKADTTSDEVEPEVKTALNQNLNTYNNVNEFGPDSTVKLIDYSVPETLPVTGKATIPDKSQTAYQEILNQQFLPKVYPRPELSINFPNINSDFQGPRDLPIYLKIKQDDQMKNQFINAQNTQFKLAEDNSYFNYNKQQLYPESQQIMDTQKTLPDKKFENKQIETRHQIPRFDQNIQESKNQVQQFYPNQEKINAQYKRLEHLNLETRNQGQGSVNSNIPLKVNEQSNQYPLFPHGIADPKINLDNKVLESERFANPYNYIQPTIFQRTLNAPTGYTDIVPANIQILFQKLASASENPRKPPINLNSIKNIQNYPLFAKPNYNTDYSLQYSF